MDAFESNDSSRFPSYHGIEYITRSGRALFVPVLTQHFTHAALAEFASDFEVGDELLGHGWDLG